MVTKIIILIAWTISTSTPGPLHSMHLLPDGVGGILNKSPQTFPPKITFFCVSQIYTKTLKIRNFHWCDFPDGMFSVYESGLVSVCRRGRANFMVKLLIIQKFYKNYTNISCQFNCFTRIFPNIFPNPYSLHNFFYFWLRPWFICSFLVYT